ncbi:substrate-binding domain-containing protein [Streptomyces sp. NPDC004561]
MFTVHQSFHADLIKGIYPEAERLGYDVLLSAAAEGRSEAKAVEALLGHRGEALILLGPEADSAYLGAPLPTAVLAGDDRNAMGLLMALTRAGVEVPRDLSVVGYDDSHLSHLMPIGLTTVRQDARLMAEHAVGFAVQGLENPEPEPREAELDGSATGVSDRYAEEHRGPPTARVLRQPRPAPR